MGDIFLCLPVRELGSWPVLSLSFLSPRCLKWLVHRVKPINLSKNIWTRFAMINSHLRVNGDLFMQDFGKANVVTHKVKVKTTQAAFLLGSTGR